MNALLPLRNVSMQARTIDAIATVLHLQPNAVANRGHDETIHQPTALRARQRVLRGLVGRGRESPDSIQVAAAMRLDDQVRRLAGAVSRFQRAAAGH